MKSLKCLSIAAAWALASSLAWAQQSAPDSACGASSLQVENGRVAVAEDGKTTLIDIKHPKTSKVKLAAARTTCRSGGGYTVCSNGSHGCVWSDRSGRLLGCGAGI
jgi:hypothetical protein